jgi:hypothetical protein
MALDTRGGGRIEGQRDHAPDNLILSFPHFGVFSRFLQQFITLKKD